MVTRSTPRSRALAVVGALALTLAVAGPAAATHTHGTLDCGTAGTFQVEPASEVEPLPFEAPGPGAGVFLIEGTTTVFKAYTIQTPQFSFVRAGASRGLTLITCTLTSTGPFFSSPWLLQGVFVR